MPIFPDPALREALDEVDKLRAELALIRTEDLPAVRAEIAQLRARLPR